MSGQPSQPYRNQAWNQAAKLTLWLGKCGIHGKNSVGPEDIKLNAPIAFKVNAHIISKCHHLNEHLPSLGKNINESKFFLKFHSPISDNLVEENHGYICVSNQ